MVSLGSGYRLCESCYEAAGALFTIRREKRPPGAASACCRCSPRARNGSACALPTSPAGPAGTVKITMIGSSVAAGRMVDNLLDRAAGESRPALSRPGGDAASGSVRSRGRDGRGAAGSVQVCSCRQATATWRTRRRRIARYLAPSRPVVFASRYLRSQAAMAPTTALTRLAMIVVAGPHRAQKICLL